jgi:hypothetical protein
MDPGDLGLEGTNQQGVPTPPDPKAQELEELRKRLSDSESANAKLREERRTERAEKLAAEHGLDAPTTELLKTLNADQMEAQAKAIAEARKVTAPPATPPTGVPQEGQQPAPAPAEPANAPAIAAMASGGDTLGLDAQAAAQNFDERLRNAKTVEEWQAIQDEAKARLRETRA